MDADKTLTDHNEQHRYAYGARHTERSNKLEKGGRSVVISKGFKSEEEGGKNFVLDFPSKEILGLEDTAGKKIHLEPATTDNMQS